MKGEGLKSEPDTEIGGKGQFMDRHYCIFRTFHRDFKAEGSINGKTRLLSNPGGKKRCK